MRIVVDHDTGRLIVANDSGVVGAWSIDDETQEWVGTPEGSPGFYTPALAALPPQVGFPNGLVAISGNQGRIRLLTLSDGSEQTVLPGSGSWVSDLVFGTDGRLHSVGMEGTARTWDTTEGGPAGVVHPLPHTGSFHVDISADGGRLAVQSDTGSFDVIDVDTGAVHSLAGQSLHISNGAAVSPDWKTVAIVPSDGGPGWVRDLETFEPMTQIPDCTFPKAFSPDSRFLVLSSNCDGAHTRVIDWAGGDTVLDLGEAYLNEAAFSPGGGAEEGRYLVAVVGNMGTEEVVMYDMATGEQVMGSVFPLTISLAFDPSGRYLAGGEIDGSAWVLDLAALLDGETPEDALIFDATTHNELVWRVRMNADGVLATTSDRSIRLWDAFDGRMIAEPYVSAIVPPVSVFGPEGDYLLYADRGSVLRPFYFDTDELLELARTRVTRDLTTEECERHLGETCG